MTVTIVLKPVFNKKWEMGVGANDKAAIQRVKVPPCSAAGELVSDMI